MLVALSVDGRIAIAPRDAADRPVAAAFARHQAGDKGFGPALGAGGAAVLAARLAERGYAVRMARSDWRLGAGEAALAAALIEGIAAAAAEAEPGSAGAMHDWAARRGAEARAGRLRLRVGHRDLLAFARG